MPTPSDNWPFTTIGEEHRMSNFAMTWKRMSPAVDAARERVTHRIEPLPTPLDGEGKLNPKQQMIRNRSHQRFVASLRALGSDKTGEVAA